ncbi:CBS domain-containing protein [Mycolicibacterium sp. P9-64]|uniref:CBS domain-containing protein n=1 Tax=Mycolicibacterium sp. P9-64 TaxID=2024612 RepID=UPI0011EE9C44|nr:CBS domain-containing protein [Mycolicibacterium sp. P9-64]KAA0087067.1 CBS domain-containing protein [Mycolicibacterium sp. P9-64]
MAEIVQSDDFEEPEERAQADAFLQSVKHKQPRTVSVKKFLALWGYKKRGAHILRVINGELSRRGLVTSPDIALADYYGEIEVLYQHDLSGRPEVEIGWPVSSVLDPERELVVVGPDESLSRVETLMIINDFSQIPVMNKSRRELHGSVTWQSIARWQGDKSGATARHVMDKDRPTARSSDSLLLHINRIIENEFLYIQDPTGLYVGILTSTDLAEGFLATAGPFIKIGEIENRLRALVDHLPLPAIQQAAEFTGATRAIETAVDLSFGQYVVILGKEENWAQLGIPFDRKTLVENLREVNAARNDVMHFRPTELDAQAAEAIDKCLNWLRAIPN